MTLGSRLKKAREKKRFTQLEVAKKLGISNGTLSGYERNYRDPDTDTLISLSDLYEVELNWLLGKGNLNKKESAHTLPENEIERIITELEKEENISIRDNPLAVKAVRQALDLVVQIIKSGK